MRKRRIAILLLSVTAVAAVAVAYHRAYPSGKRADWFRENAGNGTNAPASDFLISDYKGGLHGGPCGIGEAVNWSYEVHLSGAGDRFPFQKVDVKSWGTGHQERLVDGEVLLDRKNHVVTVSLKVAYAGKLEDFIGNGTFELRKEP